MDSPRPSDAPSSSDRCQWRGLAINLRKPSASGSGIQDPIILKRSQLDDKLNSWAGASSSTHRGEYAMSFEFPGINPSADDGKPCVHLHLEICLDGDLSFREEVFAKNDSYEGVCRANTLVISFYHMLL